MYYVLSTTFFTTANEFNRSQDDQKSLEFPLTSFISESHDSTAIAGWLFDFWMGYEKEYPNYLQIFDTVVTNFSYANIHAILYAFNNMIIAE